jgi:hypothetical protein
VTGTFTNTAGAALSGYTITAITGTASGCTSEVYSTFGTSGTRLVTSGSGTTSFTLPYGAYKVTLNSGTKTVNGTMTLSSSTNTVTVRAS